VSDTDRDDPRTSPPPIGGERELLDAWLDYQRDTLLWKCAGLSDERLKLASCPPSNLTLLGLVRHMAEVERGWLADFARSDKAWIFCTADDLDGDFDHVARPTPPPTSRCIAPRSSSTAGFFGRSRSTRR
jgi:hypothetical protein